MLLSTGRATGASPPCEAQIYLLPARPRPHSCPVCFARSGLSRAELYSLEDHGVDHQCTHARLSPVPPSGGGTGGARRHQHEAMYSYDLGTCGTARTVRRNCVPHLFPVALTSTHFDDLISPFSRVLAHSIGIPYCTAGRQLVDRGRARPTAGAAAILPLYVPQPMRAPCDARLC